MTGSDKGGVADCGTKNLLRVRRGALLDTDSRGLVAGELGNEFAVLLGMSFTQLLIV